MRKKFSILVISESSGKIKSYSLSQLGAQVLIFIFICIFGGAGWLIFEYGNIIHKNLKIHSLTNENEELRKKYQSLRLFAEEFDEFKKRTNKLANLLGVTRIEVLSNPKVKFNPATLSAGHSVGERNYSQHGSDLSELETWGNTPSISPIDGWVTKKFSTAHPGVVFSSEPGAKVVSTMNGIVESTKWDATLGNIVKITNKNGFETIYGNLSRITVVEGEAVRCGDLLGVVGSHLYYEVRLNGVAQNPENYLRKEAK